MEHVGLQPRRQQAGRRRGERHLRPRRPVGRREQRALELLPLRRALLDEAGALDGLLGSGDERQRSLGRQRRERQPPVCVACVVEHRVDLAAGLRVGVVEAHVEPVEQEARRPAAADHPAAEQRDDVRRIETELLADLVRAEDARVHRLEDRHGPLDELPVRRELPAREVEVVLEPDADVAAHERRLRHIGQLHPADRERREHAAGRELGDERHQRLRIVGRAVRDAHAELDHRRVVDQAVADQLVDHDQVPAVEHLELRPHAERLDAFGHRAQHPRAR